MFLPKILVDIEENGVRLRLTVVDTPGFGDFVNNEDRLVVSRVFAFSKGLNFLFAAGSL